MSSKAEENLGIESEGKKKESKVYIVFSSLLVSVYETLYLFLPILIWWIVSSVIGPGDMKIASLLAWPFLSVALYSASIKDGITIFNFNRKKDVRDSEILIILSIIGVVLSSVLLTLGVVSIKYNALEINTFYTAALVVLILNGMSLLVVVKAIKVQREDFNHRT